MKSLRTLIVFLLLFILFACKKEESVLKIEQKVYIVEQKFIHSVLHFTGTIQPIQEKPLSSPFEGVIDTMPFSYGQTIQKGQVVCVLNSIELQKQYNDLLTDYLKAKDSYAIARAKFAGTEDLWKEGLVSKNNYLSEKSGLNNTRISLIQTTQKLSEILEKTDELSYKDLADLSFADFKRVRLALAGKHNLISIKAPISGVLLYPPKSNDDKGNRISIGAMVKAGQVLGLIGDFTGLRMEIEIPEVDIGKIKPGMLATIRGIAFSKETLKGQLVSVNAQALASNNTVLPSFSAVIEVRHLTKDQQALIRVGMSASVDLTIDSQAQIMIPIQAIKEQKGHRVVFVQEESGQITTRVVETGAAQADQVVIESGLKVGEKIIY